MRLHTLFSFVGLALLLALNLPAQTVRVIFVSGHAELQRPDEAAPHAVQKGESVIIGTRISTGADGRVVLTPMPGVKSMIAPNTIIVLESASDSHPSATEVKHQATIDLKVGAVVTDLQTQPGATFDYSIRTPRGLAGARGTTFTVGLNDAGIETIVVAHGTISLILADGRTISLGIGQVSITQPGGETHHAPKLSDLSSADQALAKKWILITLETLANAVDSGIQLQPDALQNALDAAKNLGVILPPELQALVERVLNKLKDPAKPYDGTDPKTVSEVITEQNQITGFASIDAYIATLTTDQASAFNSLRNGPQSVQQPTFTTLAVNIVITPGTQGGYTDAELTQLLRNGKLAAGLTDILNLYVEFKQSYPLTDNDMTTFLSRLGILGNGNFTAVGSDTVGLKALLQAYIYSYYSPEHLSEGDYPEGNHSTVYGADFFFPGAGYNNDGKGVTIYDVTFDTDGGTSLRIGATRNLLLDNVTLNAGYSDASGAVQLLAADLVSLNNTTFGSYVTSITISAATINLANTTFRDGTSVYLNSKLGQANFGSSKIGYVNFIQNVNYGSTSINATTLPTLENIHINQLGNR